MAEGPQVCEKMPTMAQERGSPSLECLPDEFQCPLKKVAAVLFINKNHEKWGVFTAVLKRG